MSGRGDQQIDVAIARILARGPTDSLALIEKLRSALPNLLRGQEGSIHAVLQAGIRRGTLKLAGRSIRGMALYAPVEATPAPGHAAAPELGALDRRLSRTALRVAGGVRDPADRGRVLGDVVAHLGELEGKGAWKAFGPPRRARTFLQRADRKKRSVFFTADLGDSVRRLALHEGPWILAAIVLFFVVKFFVAEVYQIPSESMRPTLAVGDRVLVSRLAGAPERFDLVVFHHAGKALVKRLLGLGGEEIALWQGDVYIDGKLVVKPDAVREALRFPSHTWSFQDGRLDGWQARTEADLELWTFGAYGDLSGEHDFHGRPLAQPLPLFDGYLRIAGRMQPKGHLLVRLARGLLGTPRYPDAVRWTLEVGPEGAVVMEEQEGKPPQVLERAVFRTSGQAEIELAYVDGVVRARVGSWTWRAPRPAPYYPLDLTVGGRDADVRQVSLDHDLHYAHLLILGVPTARDLATGRHNPHPIPPGHLFFLGDNSRDSKDSRSRDVGDIPADQVVGPVCCRIWPPGRIGRAR